MGVRMKSYVGIQKSIIINEHILKVGIRCVPGSTPGSPYSELGCIIVALLVWQCVK